MDDIELAHELAATASLMAMRFFATARSTTRLKPDGTPVTDADVAIEHALRKRLAQQRPRDGFLGEESGPSGVSERTWIVDPIDGTFNFVRGDSAWGTHIALRVRDRIVLGIITRPARSEIWSAVQSQGAHVTTATTSRRLRVSDVAGMKAARVTAWVDEASPLAQRLKSASRWVTPTLDAILQLASGDLEAVIDVTGKPWDHAPAALLVAEAGGRFTDVHGGSRLDMGEVRYSNGLIHAPLVQLLNA